MRKPELLVTGPATGPTVVLAHGAGAPMDSPSLNAIAAGLAKEGIRVARFEFPYMRARREEARRRPPDREPVLREAWKAAIEELGGAGNLVIGGKSMGGRIASLIADEVEPRGLVCLGYPFHPPGQLEEDPDRAPGAPAHPGPDRPGHARSVRHPGRGRRLQALASDPDRLAGGRRPLVQAAGVVRPDGGAERGRGGGRGGGVCGVGGVAWAWARAAANGPRAAVTRPCFAANGAPSRRAGPFSARARASSRCRATLRRPRSASFRCEVTLSGSKSRPIRSKLTSRGCGATPSRSGATVRSPCTTPSRSSSTSFYSISSLNCCAGRVRRCE